MPIAADGESDMTAMAAEVTTRLIDGLAKIDNIRVTATQTAPQDSRILQPDFVVSGELQKSERSWEVRGAPDSDDDWRSRVERAGVGRGGH